MIVLVCTIKARLSEESQCKRPYHCYDVSPVGTLAGFPTPILHAAFAPGSRLASLNALSVFPSLFILLSFLVHGRPLWLNPRNGVTTPYSLNLIGMRFYTCEAHS